MEAKLPRQISKSLPRQIRTAESVVRTIEKSYRYQQLEPTYVPFYQQLKSFFEYQQREFKMARVVNRVYRYRNTMTKSDIKRLVQRELGPQESALHNILVKNYRRKFNMLKSIMGERALAELPPQKRRQLELVAKRINQHTRDRITKNLYDNIIEKGMSLPRAKVRLKSLFTEMSWYRSERISKTELTKAHNECILDSYKSLGVKKKHWILCGKCTESGSCKECRTNMKKGWIPIDATFPSGVKYPPAHPNCVCGIY